jgi:DnaK suppressor protein
MNSLKIKPDIDRQKVLSEIEKRLNDEQRQVELAILASKNAGGNGLEVLWQERDSPAEDEIREVEFNHRASLLGQWRDIEDARQRLKQQSYGRCIDCGKKIAIKRLSANPRVSRCLACQTGIEGDISTPSL